MKLQLICETPVHVGSGLELEPFDYVIHNGYLIKFKKEKCFSEIYKRIPKGITLFSQWLEEMAVQMDAIEQEKSRAGRDKNLKRNKNQELSAIRKKLNLIHFCENELKSPDLAQEFLTNPDYHEDKIFCPEKPGGNRKVREIIRENGRPLIPGSSIKGAIRTALGYSAIKQMPSSDLNRLIRGDASRGIEGIEEPLKALEQILKRLQKSLSQNGNSAGDLKKYKDLQGKYQKTIGQRVENFIFGTGFRDHSNRNRWGDPKYDLLKFLLVSDAYPVQKNLLIGNVYSVTRDKYTGGMKRPQSILLAELFDEGSVLEFEMDFASTLLLKILQSERKNAWIGLEPAFKRLFQSDLGSYDGSQKGVQRLKEDVTKQIFSSLNDFSRAILKRDKAWTQQFSDGSTRKLADTIANLEKKETLIRIGFSSGWHSTTMGLALSEREELRPFLKEIIYAFNLDLIQNQKKQFRPPKSGRPLYERQKRALEKLLNRIPDEKLYPKSRRVLGENKSPSDWMGWASIHTDFKNDQTQTGKSASNEKPMTEEDDFQKKLLELKKKFGG